jgi:hypothetical protein
MHAYTHTYIHTYMHAYIHMNEHQLQATWPVPLASKTSSAAGQQYFPAPLAGQHRWRAMLISTANKQHWPAALASHPGQHGWPAILASATGQQYWPAPLASNAGQHQCAAPPAAFRAPPPTTSCVDRFPWGRNPNPHLEVVFWTPNRGQKVDRKRGATRLTRTVGVNRVAPTLWFTFRPP